MNKNLVCYFDGACEPKNPGGNMGLGACIFSVDQPPRLQDDIPAGAPVFQHSEFIEADYGNSNNVAEYLALEKILQWLAQNAQTGTTVFIYGDSNLAIEQMLGNWKMKAGFYIPVAKRCQEKIQDLKKELGLKIFLQWIPRQKNTFADSLSKKELINHNVEFKLQKQ